MRTRWMIALVAALAMVALTGAKTCRTLPAKTWTGDISYYVPEVPTSTMWFTSNDCTWAGQDSLNGHDARVFAIPSKYAGTKTTLTWSSSNPVRPSAGVTLTAWDGACQSIQAGPFTAPEANTPFKFVIPTGTRWLIAQAAGAVPTSDIDVTVRSAGRRCR